MIGLFTVDESLNEAGHLTLLNDAIIIDVKLGEELIELLSVGWSLTLDCEDLVEEVGGLDLVKGATVICVILFPDFVNEFADVFGLAAV